MKIRSYLLPVCAALGVLTAMLAHRNREQAAPRAQVPLAKPAPVQRTETAPMTRADAPSQVRPARHDSDGSAAASADVIGSTDPTSKLYDPITLMRVMNVAPLELMNKEPRDAAFAGPREAALRARIEERLRKRLDLDARVDVKCHTSSCEVTLQPATGTGDLAAAVQALDLDTLAEAMQLGPASMADVRQKAVSIIMLYSSELRDHAAYERWLRQHEANDAPPPKSP